MRQRGSGTRPNRRGDARIRVAAARPRARGLARRDARRFDHVTLMRGAAALAVATILRGKADSSPLRAHVTLTRGPAALAVATDALAVQFCPEASPGPTALQATRARSWRSR